MSSISESFELNEVVWAKVLGYPWWPAQIASISNQTVKSNLVPMYRVYFVADGSHADLRNDKLKKWEWKPQQAESKKLKEAIDIAKQIISGLTQPINKSLQSLNDHNLKNFVIQLSDLVGSIISNYQQITKFLDNMTNMETLQIVKLNYGQQLFKVLSALKKDDYNETAILINELLDSLINVIGYKKKQQDLTNRKKPSMEEIQEEITKYVFIQSERTGSPIKKKKPEQDTDINNNNFNQI